MMSYTDDRDSTVEVLRIREKSEAMIWLAEFGRREELIKSLWMKSKMTFQVLSRWNRPYIP